MKKKVFVGSSTESKSFAEMLCSAVNQRYSDQLELELWDNINFFPLSHLTLPRLLEELPKRDGAIFILTSLDEKWDKKSNRRPRDNILLEIGLALGRLGEPNVIVLKPINVQLGSDLDAFKCLEVDPTLEQNSDTNKENIGTIAETIYLHFFKNPLKPSERLGRESFRELLLIRCLTQGVLAELKWRGIGYDRIRLYRFNPHIGSFDGLVELGGVGDNFRRVRIPIRTDVLSQLLLKEQACLLHKRTNHDYYVITESGIGKDRGNTIEPVPIIAPKHLTSHDLPSLARESIREWMDVPLIVQEGPNRGKIVGKMTIDNARKEKLDQYQSNLNVCDQQLWQHAAVAADFLDLFERDRLPEQVFRTSGNWKIELVYEQAFRLAMLDDQLRTLLAQIRNHFNFDRLRLYLTISKHMSLFNDYVMATAPEKRAYSGIPGFWGHVELGGVRTFFSDLVITDRVDHCTRICLGKAQKHEEPIQKIMLQGEPVIFWQQSTNKSNKKYNRKFRPSRCEVQGFYRPFVLDRETITGDKEIPEHLDLPIVSNGKIIGKVTIDNKWSNPDQISIEEYQIESLMLFGKKISAVIEAADLMPDHDLCDAIEKTLKPNELLLL
jgi:hypothetical protein